MTKKSHNSESNHKDNYLNEYTEKEIQGFDDEQIDIAYEHGVSHIKEISNDTRIINTRATLLLGYLIGAVVLLLSKNLNPSILNIEIFGYSAVSIIVILYIAIIGVLVFAVVKPEKTFPIYIAPKHILANELLEYSTKKEAAHKTRLLKFSIIEFLQAGINNNIRKQNYKYKVVNFCIFIAFVPLFIFAIQLFLTIF